MSKSNNQYAVHFTFFSLSDKLPATTQAPNQQLKQKLKTESQQETDPKWFMQREGAK